MNLALGIAAINNLSLAATDVHVEMTEGTRTVIAFGVQHILCVYGTLYMIHYTLYIVAHMKYSLKQLKEKIEKIPKYHLTGKILQL